MTTNINTAPATALPPYPIRVMRKLWRFAIDRPYRKAIWLYLLRPVGAFQPFNDTKHDRYPVIFSFVQSVLGGDSAVRILSYGCSTGEEVFSLRQYFPSAVIKGIDINRANIAVCRRRLKRSPDAGLSFAVAPSTTAEPSAGYDAIFCMAVLRHDKLGRPGVIRCDHLIRFEDFAHAVTDCERCLKPGGLLIIRHSNFRFCDAPIAQAFETILRLPHNAKTPLFGSDNRLLASGGYLDTVFRKKLNA
jgi:2-polyprenyl-3-methyl-5-hydroxy-6-metoxy-1,4-benzoquinol methylase